MSRWRAATTLTASHHAHGQRRIDFTQPRDANAERRTKAKTKTKTSMLHPSIEGVLHGTVAFIAAARSRAYPSQFAAAVGSETSVSSPPLSLKWK